MDVKTVFLFWQNQQTFLEIHRNTSVSIASIQELKNGNEKAFGDIFHHFSDRVFNFAQKYIHNPADAEEVTQEVFVKLWETRKAVDPSANFSAYLYTITRNLIFNRHKKKVNEWAYLDYLKNYLVKTNNDTEHAVFLSELSEIIKKNIQQMPEKRRIVFELSRTKGLSHKEISNKLNISTKTIEVHIGLALKELRLALKDYYIIALLFVWL